VSKKSCLEKKRSSGGFAKIMESAYGTLKREAPTVCSTYGHFQARLLRTVLAMSSAYRHCIRNPGVEQIVGEISWPRSHKIVFLPLKSLGISLTAQEER